MRLFADDLAAVAEQIEELYPLVEEGGVLADSDFSVRVHSVISGDAIGEIVYLASEDGLVYFNPHSTH